MSTYVYVIIAQNNSKKNLLCKVGSTRSSLLGRIDQLQTGCPYALKIFFSVLTDNEELERVIHKTWSKKNIRREWFKLPWSDCVNIFNLMSENSIDNNYYSHFPHIFHNLEKHENIVNLNEQYV